MSDLLVTLPKSFGMEAWLLEGDPAGSPASGTEYVYTVGGGKPPISPGERVYVCYSGRLIGYAPLVRVERWDAYRWGLIRAGGAVAVTIDEPIRGFRGFRNRWWDYADERPFPDWATP